MHSCPALPAARPTCLPVCLPVPCRCGDPRMHAWCALPPRRSVCIPISVLRMVALWRLPGRGRGVRAWMGKRTSLRRAESGDVRPQAVSSDGKGNGGEVAGGWSTGEVARTGEWADCEKFDPHPRVSHVEAGATSEMRSGPSSTATAKSSIPWAKAPLASSGMSSPSTPCQGVATCEEVPTIQPDASSAAPRAAARPQYCAPCRRLGQSSIESPPACSATRFSRQNLRGVHETCDASHMDAFADYPSFNP